MQVTLADISERQHPSRTNMQFWSVAFSSCCIYWPTLSLHLISLFFPDPCTVKCLNGYWVCFKLNFTTIYSIDLVTEHMDLLFEISLWQTYFGKLCVWNIVNDLDSKYWLGNAVIYSRAHSQLSLSAIFFSLIWLLSLKSVFDCD